jgi:Flp pilus assembly protein TadB
VSRRTTTRGRRPLPKRPYRDSAILYGVLAVAIVVFSAVTGGSLVRAVLFALAFFALATAWSWYRWRARLREERRA